MLAPPRLATQQPKKSHPRVAFLLGLTCQTDTLRNRQASKPRPVPNSSRDAGSGICATSLFIVWPRLTNSAPAGNVK